MALSQNGYVANDPKRMKRYAHPAGVFNLLNNECGWVLTAWAIWFHNNIEKLREGWNWSYASRTIRGSSTALSNHASGTAIDLNAPLHPLGTKPEVNFAAWQIKKMREELARWRGVIRWGGDYSGRKDPMHFEINASYDRVVDLANWLRANGYGIDGGGIGPITTLPVVNHTPAPAPKPAPAPSDILREGDRGPAVTAWQDELWRVGVGVGVHDGIYGPATVEGTRQFQAAAGIGVDGIVGPATRAAIARVPSYPKAPGPELPLCAPGGPKGTVEIFQKRFQERGWKLFVDGIYGPGTRSVIEKFQREKGLAVDGVGGPAVWVALWLRTT